MNLKEIHCFEDAHTAQHFEIMKHNFIIRNDRDVYYDFHTSREIPGMKRRVLVETIPGASSQYWTECHFYLATFACFAPCYRAHFLRKTGKEHVYITKSVQKLPQTFWVTYAPNYHVVKL